MKMLTETDRQQAWHDCCISNRFVCGQPKTRLTRAEQNRYDAGYWPWQYVSSLYKLVFQIESLSQYTTDMVNHVLSDDPIMIARRQASDIFEFDRLLSGKRINLLELLTKK